MVSKIIFFSELLGSTKYNCGRSFSALPQKAICPRPAKGVGDGVGVMVGVCVGVGVKVAVGVIVGVLVKVVVGVHVG